MKMGGQINTDSISFRVYYSGSEEVSVVLNSGELKLEIPLWQEDHNIYSRVLTLPDTFSLYKFKIQGQGEFPDPYSQYQPFGIHGYSKLVDHSTYQWQTLNWQGKSLEDLTIMEIHVGTFTPQGTFRAVVDKLDYLVDLGITALEVMPVTQTPGRWNWGYDGINLFSVNHNYGAPHDLKYLIDCCHQKGLFVILDVVYNHFGPEGNYLAVYGPAFTDKHQTPWGQAVNYDDQYNEYMRKMVLDNVSYWLEIYRFDGLRLDAVHAIKDDSHLHILQEISLVVDQLREKLKRKLYLIAESDENHSRLITPKEKRGYGMDAQWLDDFHHVIHTALTGEREGYYIDYGRIEDFTKVFKNYLYTGEYSHFWKKNRGTDGSEQPGHRFVVAVQNHDQVGNRAQGDRLSTLVPFPFLKAAAGLLFVSPYIPLLFMGEEYGEKNPFLFFTDYLDPTLREAVSKGRKEEFKSFTWDNVPDPQKEDTFYHSKLTPQAHWDQQNHQLFLFYRDLIKLRSTHPVLKILDKKNLEAVVEPQKKLLTITRWNQDMKLTAIFNLGPEVLALTLPQGRILLNSEGKKYGGSVEGYEGKFFAGQMIIIETIL